MQGFSKNQQDSHAFLFSKECFKDITEMWEGEALPADKADVAQNFLIPEINNLLKLVEEQASKEALFDVMNDISSMCAGLDNYWSIRYTSL